MSYFSSTSSFDYVDNKNKREEDREWEREEKMEDIVENIDNHLHNIRELKHECHDICSSDYNDYTSCHDFCNRIGIENSS